MTGSMQIIWKLFTIPRISAFTLPSGELRRGELKNDMIYLALKENSITIMSTKGDKGDQVRGYVVIQVRDHGASDYVDISGSSENWIDSGLF